MAEDTPRARRFEGVGDLFSELSRMRELGVLGRESGEPRERTHASAWVPTTDIFARGDDLVIRLELPGVAPDDVVLGLSHGVLTVSGTRATADTDGDGVDDEVSFYVRERYSGEFRRSFTLPDETDPADVTAEFGDGLVEVVVRGGAASTDSARIEVAVRSRPPQRRTLS